jgi:hypothetical protein
MCECPELDGCELWMLERRFDAARKVRCNKEDEKKTNTGSKRSAATWRNQYGATYRIVGVALSSAYPRTISTMPAIDAIV